eukprot:CAMPEP_0181234240 /NCGR_PEP_ID=MMETSP1096-20121128/36842_1 /TAXON_ID=156174 ORGANISM="Chrysochromulina ericina, Strain CCMP281" /NCGR_SAMPLE_ID=MMETSP1096 /ASSEMBLY_ACC=CAM_ASM_000453 /LENGTH=96 /DNA_ID=CAMNT_0023328951 /DNA_START=454 /DNA_END=741 /DNA_ORIENTATION=+
MPARCNSRILQHTTGIEGWVAQQVVSSDVDWCKWTASSERCAQQHPLQEAPTSSPSLTPRCSHPFSLQVNLGRGGAAPRADSRTPKPDNMQAEEGP